MPVLQHTARYLRRLFPCLFCQFSFLNASQRTLCPADPLQDSGDRRTRTSRRTRRSGRRLKRCCPGQAARTNIAPYILLFSVGGMLIQIIKTMRLHGRSREEASAFVLAGHRLLAPRRTFGTRLRAHFGASTFSERRPVRSRQRRPIGFSAPLRGCAARYALAAVAHLLSRPRCLRHVARRLRLRVANCRSRRHHGPRRGGPRRP